MNMVVVELFTAIVHNFFVSAVDREDIYDQTKVETRSNSRNFWHGNETGIARLEVLFVLIETADM